MKIRLTNQIDVKGKIYVGKGKIYIGRLITTTHDEKQQHAALILADNTEEAREKLRSWATEEFPSRDSSKDEWEVNVALVII